jgi:hypothetical protein
MSARFLFPWLFLVASANLMADEPGYRISIESSVKDNKLTVAPRVAAPVGARLRYEMVSTKVGAAGKSNTSQSGRVVVDASGTAALSALKLGVGPQDRYSISVKVFEGQKLVAEQTLQHPQ